MHSSPNTVGKHIFSLFKAEALRAHLVQAESSLLNTLIGPLEGKINT